MPHVKINNLDELRNQVDGEGEVNSGLREFLSRVDGSALTFITADGVRPDDLVYTSTYVGYVPTIKSNRGRTVRMSAQKRGIRSLDDGAKDIQTQIHRDMMNSYLFFVYEKDSELDKQKISANLFGYKEFVKRCYGPINQEFIGKLGMEMDHIHPFPSNRSGASSKNKLNP